MITKQITFSNIMEAILRLPMTDKLEVKNLLEHNIADTRRNEIFENYKKSQLENKNGKSTFSSDIKELKKML